MRQVGNKKTLPTLHKSLNYARVQYKIRLMHFLMTDLVQREDINLIEPNESYPIWTPLNAVEAADTLLMALAEENQGATIFFVFTETNS